MTGRLRSSRAGENTDVANAKLPLLTFLNVLLTSGCGDISAAASPRRGDAHEEIGFAYGGRGAWFRGRGERRIGDGQRGYPDADSPLNTNTFDNNPVGSQSGTSTACYTSAGCVGISFETDGAVAQGLTSGVSAPPAGDTSHYLWGLTNGALVTFSTPVTYFDFYWGSIDALTTSNGSTRYDNTLYVQTYNNGVTGTDLVAANTLLNPVVNGFGDQFSANDNQWFQVSLASGGAIDAFLGTSTSNAFEFDMPGAIPEPSTWVMMVLGFGGLGFAAWRTKKGPIAAFTA
jgi:hypothetical protein